MFSKSLRPLVFATLALFATTNTTIVRRPSPTSYQCSVLSESISTLQLQFESTTNTYVVDLSRTHASRNKHTILIDNAHHQFDVSHHKWMSGHVADHVGSSARIHVDISTPSVCDDVSGTFKVANKTTYVLEQVDGELHIHKETDLVAAAAKKGLRFDSGDESQNKSRYRNRSIASDDEKFRHRREQRSRRATLSLEGISCGVFLDADLSFFEAHKGSCSTSLSEAACATLQQERVTVKMIDSLQMTAEIYQSDSVLKSYIDFHVEGTHIIDKNLFVHNANPSEALEMYDGYLKDVTTRKSDAVCLNHLFSDANFEGASIGIAAMGRYKNGVCGINGGNAGITTTGDNIPHRLMVRTVAHEIGHNLGAMHDKDVKCEDGFLMQAWINENLEMSTCTQTSIKKRLDELETVPNDFSYGPIRCLKKVVPCESGAGNCCNNGILENSGIVCRDADCEASPPLKKATCDGVHAYCPQGASYNDTESCGVPPPPPAVVPPPPPPPAVVPPPPPGSENVCRDSYDGFISNGQKMSCSTVAAMCTYPMPGLLDACPETCDKCDLETTTVTAPTRICRVDEYVTRTSHRDTESSRVLSTIKGSSTVECAKKCAEDTRCSSFNYNKADSQTCELTSAPDVTQSYATTASSDWDNYQMSGACYGDCPATIVSRFVNGGGVPMRDKSGKSGNLLQTITNVNKNKCSKLCEKNADCYAFNHRTSLDREKYPYKCELLKAPDLYDFSYHVPADTTVGWRYFRMTSSCASVKMANKLASGTASASIIVPIVFGVLLVLVVLVVGYIRCLKPKMVKKSSKTHPAEPTSETGCSTV